MKSKSLTPQGHPCFECGGGILRPVREPFTTRTSEGLEITIPDVLMERCNVCGDTVLSGEATGYVNDYLDRATSRLSREELQAFLDQYGLTQREAEQILGLGEKMIGRWLNPTSRTQLKNRRFSTLLGAGTLDITWASSQKCL